MTALEGVRVLDFSRLLPGPLATWLLADFGAEVIRVEHPRELAKQARVFGWDRLSQDERARLREHDMLARNKKSILLDIGDSGAQEVIKALAVDVDVVVEDYRPGVLAGLGLGYEALRQANPGLVYCSLTLCGQTGPYRDKPGHDPIALSLAGVTSRIGEDLDTPGFAGIPVADVVTGTQAAFAILAALHARDRDGEGQMVDVAMSDCSMTLLINVLSRHPDLRSVPPRGVRRADTGIWRTADGKFICTTDMEPRYWQRFCETVGKPDFIPLQNESSERPAIRAALDEIFAAKTQREWLEVLGAAGTQFAPVYDISEALADPHNQARGMVCDVPISTGETTRQLGTPTKLSRTPAEVRHAAHSPGADTAAVLSELGLSEATIEEITSTSQFAVATPG